MTNEIKSAKERLAALRGETAGMATDTRERLERIASERAIEEQERESHEVMANIAKSEANVSTGRKIWNVVKGDEERNPNNLYGFGTLCKKFGDAVEGPAKSIAKAVGLNWAFNKASHIWDSSPLGPLRWAVDKSQGTMELASEGVKKWVSMNYNMYNKARKTHHDDGTVTLHPGRAIASIALSLLATTTVLGAMYETPIIAYEGAVYAATTTTSDMILNGVHAVQGERDMYLTGGCDAAEKVCTEHNTTQFRIKPSNFLFAKNALKGHWWRPEMVAMAIPNQTAHCQVEYAGGRWKMLGRAFDIYPYIVDVKCQESPAGSAPAVSFNGVTTPAPAVALPAPAVG